MINYRTVADLNGHIISALPKLPRNIDLIVGIPRSGYLAGSLFALHLNCALTDPKGLLENRLLSHGVSRPGYSKIKNVEDARAILVVDDSIFSGNQMKLVRSALASSPLAERLIFAAVYALPESKDKVDIYCNICPTPRMFEWNMMHDRFLLNACVDLDGVLCCDPSEEENDDGLKYLNFIQNAKPYMLPTTPIGYIVTCRLEKYRAATEKWLRQYNIEYKRLAMMDLPSKEARVKAGNYAQYKAKVCKDVGGTLFLESEVTQANTIARLADVDVFCFENRAFITPSTAQLINQAVRKSPLALKGVFRRIVRKGALFGLKLAK